MFTRRNDIIDLLAQSKPKIYSTLDLFSGFWQCEIHENSRHKTAFVIGNRHLQFRRLPFGLKNSPSFFILMGNKVLKGLTSKLCSIYIDDIIVWSITFDEHLDHLSQIFDRLRAANLKLKPSKCNFAKSGVLYLDHIISGQGVSINPEKVEIVKSIPLPKSQHDVHAFLGLTNYYRTHVRNYVKIASPLNKLLSKDVPFKWTDDCDKAFQLLKDMLTSAPILAFPDMTKSFILTCDASGSALSYNLSQKGDE